MATVVTMLPSWFAVLALAVTAPLSFAAAVSAWRGKFLPNPVTWVLWAAVPMIAAAAALASGAGLSALSTLSAGAGPAMILAASLLGPHRAKRWPVKRADLACGGLALLAVAGWAVTGSGLVAVVLSVLADSLAGVPTMRKAWSHPSTETPWGYISGVVSGATGLLTLHVWNPTNWLFPAYLLVWCGALVLLVAFPGNREHASAAA